MDYWEKDIYSWGIFSAEVYPRSSIDNVWFWDEAHFLLSGHMNSKNNILWGSTPPEYVCKCHYTLWSALPGLSSPNMASLDHSGSRRTTSGLWQSTPSDMSRCMASSGQPWSTERGRQGPPVVPAGWCHPHSSNESWAWLQQRFPDRLISHRCDPQWSPHPPDLNPPDFYLWGYLKDRVYRRWCVAATIFCWCTIDLAVRVVLTLTFHSSYG